MRTVFTSSTSFQDAAVKAQSAGYTVVGQAQNSKGFIVFAEKKENTVNWDWRGKL
jgi:hypothetical protein